MKTLIKWIAVAVLAGGTLYVATNYNIGITPAAAQEVCQTVDTVKSAIAENILAVEVKTGQNVDYTTTEYKDEVADNFLANALGIAGYDEASIKVAVDEVGTVLVFSSAQIPNSLIVIFDNNGCKAGHTEIPSGVLDTINSEASTI